MTDPHHTVPSEQDSGAPDDDLAVALALADLADAVSLPRFGAGDLQVTSKPDLTPVTDADLAVETALRRHLAAARPTDVVVGEEFGLGDTGAGQNGDAVARRWVIDPIDGTKNFVRGVPVWATLIALFVGDEITTGVVSAPALGRRWWAGAGRGARTSAFGGPSRVCRVSGVADLADASLSYSELGEWEQAGALEPFLRLQRSCWRTRAYGDFWSYVLVAEGAVDLAAEPELSVWDLAALVPIVTEAGGRFTDVRGATVDWSTTSAIATNGRLHAPTVAALTAS
ncbi:inositol monophosphatase family protein [Nakamurella leprariae]|uniref:Histidinol phosphatase n=1 Tax=Nakamurella leprariae TaxID=2803911 RepID=A0A938YFJ7_9ACTN|nr:inositol monophosphatase family protein [Nakamurella leprariae]MBM9467219.1 histidinol phosphatase [Nakamurella leprariae]